MKTFNTKPADIHQEWYVVDAEGKTLGRLASGIASVLVGKHKKIFTPHLDCGDYVIVLNASKIHVTGKKLNEKMYYHHSGYPGGMKSVVLRTQLEKHPDRVIKAAVWGMMPHSRLGREMFKKLKVFAGTTHPHLAQKPNKLEV